MKLQHIAAAVALATAGVAHASLDDMYTGNSSLAFIAFDAVMPGNVNPGTGSVFVDLGLNLNDFVSTADPMQVGGLGAEGNKVVWNFNANTITVNGVTQATTNDFSAVAPFLAHIDDPARWAVIAGDANSVPQRILTTGTPTASALTQQVSSLTAGSVRANATWTNSGVSSAVDNGSYYAANSADPNFVAASTNFGTNWVSKLKWASTTTGAQNNFWMALGDGSEQQVGVTHTAGADTTGLLNNNGTFTWNQSAGTLTWATAAPVPEPESYALALVGLAAAGFVARRRSAK
ncbi:MAG: PEP-CTERM sorting domain-containing protein [Burkholderiales bacterium]|nr:PEP-CTERM sorting domain-containing protein [Burkholderiales bacterium]MDE2433287.1 PEP-CTERM sorting domain-containing protein [Burkholderiales bacterium]